MNELIDSSREVSIFDNVLCARKIILHSKKSDVNGVVCKLDFSKASDRFFFDFLIKVLAARNFSMR